MERRAGCPEFSRTSGFISTCSRSCAAAHGCRSRPNVLEWLDEDVLPVAILTIHTSDQILNFNSHIHGSMACGGFGEK